MSTSCVVLLVFLSRFLSYSFKFSGLFSVQFTSCFPVLFCLVVVRPRTSFYSSPPTDSVQINSRFGLIPVEFLSHSCSVFVHYLTIFCPISLMFLSSFRRWSCTHPRVSLPSCSCPVSDQFLPCSFLVPLFSRTFLVCTIVFLFMSSSSAVHVHYPSITCPVTTQALCCWRPVCV